MGFTMPRYNSPFFQTVLVGCVCFCVVGMYSAISALGAGGTQNIQLSDTAQSVLYTFFAIVGIVSGSICNILGPRLTLFIGTLGYGMYVGALWCYQVTGTQWFLIFSGAVLGVTAALLWAAQGQIMVSYPDESSKGRAFSVFWSLFNGGALVGGLIALGLNLKNGGLAAVSTSTYIAFLVVILLGVCLSWTLLPPAKVVRSDGSIVKLAKYDNVRTEVTNLWKAAKSWKVIVLIPMFFSSNFFYTYQSALAVKLFNTPTRALNGVVKSSGQVVGSIIMGVLLDKLPFSRRTRGFCGLGVTTAFIILAYGWGLHYQLGFTRATKITTMSFHERRFAQPMTIIAFYDIGDAFYQALAYWIMGAMTSDSFETARIVGFYKALQSAGSAIAFGMDATKQPYLNELLGSWLQLMVALPLAGLVIYTVQETDIDPAEVVYAAELEKNGDVSQNGVLEGDEKVVAK